MKAKYTNVLHRVANNGYVLISTDIGYTTSNMAAASLCSIFDPTTMDKLESDWKASGYTFDRNSTIDQKLELGLCAEVTWDEGINHMVSHALKLDCTSDKLFWLCETLKEFGDVIICQKGKLYVWSKDSCEVNLTFVVD